MPRLGALGRAYLARRFTLLFGVLLAAIAGHSVVGAVLPVANPLDWLLGLSLVAVVLSVPRGRLRGLLFAVASLAVAARLLEPVLEHPAPALAGRAAFGLACLLTAGVALRRSLLAGPIDAEHLFAALDAYLLVGIAFGAAYWLVETAAPGSFSAGSGEALSPERCIYFSFVTQTTVGYGDVLPASDPARGLVLVQAVGGQIYLAVLVARLVSLYSAQDRDEGGAGARESDSVPRPASEWTP